MEEGFVQSGAVKPGDCAASLKRWGWGSRCHCVLPGVPIQCDERPSRPCLRRRTSAARARSRFDIAPVEEDPLDGAAFDVPAPVRPLR